MKVQSERAFSLIEILVVIAILSILTIIVVPSFAKYIGNVHLKEAARDITGDIEFYKQKAVTENIKYQIQFNVANNGYIIQKETSPDIWVNVSPMKNIGKDYAEIKIAKDPTFPGDKITFQPRGTTSAGTLVINHQKLFSKASIKTSLMGRVRIIYELQ